MPSACAVVLHLSASERNRLKTCSSSPSMPHRVVIRAKIVRLAAAGVPNAVIAARLGLKDDTVRRWRDRRQSWVLPIVETRAHPGLATLAGHEAVLDLLRRSVFSLHAAAHAYAVLGAFVYGFALQEGMLETVGLPDDPVGLMENMDLGRFPRIAELAELHATASDYPMAASFDGGVTILLDGIERIADASPER